MKKLSEYTSLQKKLGLAISICTLIGMAYGGIQVIKSELQTRVKRIIKEEVKQGCLKGSQNSNPALPTRRRIKR